MEFDNDEDNTPQRHTEYLPMQRSLPRLLLSTLRVTLAAAGNRPATHLSVDPLPYQRQRRTRKRGRWKPRPLPPGKKKWKERKQLVGRQLYRVHHIS
jgi:hypothetical protein